MHINVTNIPQHVSINGKYNKSIKALMECIFNGNNQAKIKYITSSNENFKQERYSALYAMKQIENEGCNLKREVINPQAKELQESDDSFIDINLLGPLELGLLNCLLIKDYKVIVVTGALGSGKTELVNYLCYLLKHYKKHINCNCFKQCNIHQDSQVFTDFNREIISGETEDEIIKQFHSYMFYELGNKITKLMSRNEIFIDKFISWCDKGNSRYFIGLSMKMLYTYNNWDKLSQENKFKCIFLWLQERFEKQDKLSGLIALLEIFKFYHEQFPRKDQTCLLFVYDNIDGLDELAQNIIIEQINRIAEQTPCKAIVTSRLTTFNYIKGNASFSFGVYQNAGQAPIDVIIARMEHYLKNKDTDIDYKNIRHNIKTINPKYLQAFDERITLLYSGLVNNNLNRLRKTINSLSGLSIRRGLRLFRRLFYNHTISWDDTQIKEDLLIRSIYSYDYDYGIMKLVDRRLSNIFAEIGTDRISLINLRILNIINTSKKRGIIITKKDLITHLSLFDNINDPIINNNLDYLRNYRKRLLFISGFGTYSKYMCEQDDAQIAITYAGTLYIDYLSSDLQYVQSCFESIDWNFNNSNEVFKAVDYINVMTKDSLHKKILSDALLYIADKRIEEILPTQVNYSSFIERIQFIRMALRLLMCKDIVETINYKEKYESQDKTVKEIIGINCLITIPIIINTSSAIYYINRENEANEIINELIEWQNLLITIKEWNLLLFPTSEEHKKINSLLEKYQSKTKI